MTLIVLVAMPLLMNGMASLSKRANRLFTATISNLVPMLSTALGKGPPFAVLASIIGVTGEDLGEAMAACPDDMAD